MKRTQTFSLMVRPEWLNGYGGLHGAEYVKICDELAGVTADGYCPISFVTGTICGFQFIRPAHVRDILRATGKVLFAKGRQIGIEIKLYVRPRLQTEEMLCAKGYFVMVPMDQEQQVPAYWPEDEAEVRLATQMKQTLSFFQTDVEA